MADLGENCKREGKGAVSRWEDWMEQKLLEKRWPLEQRGAGCHENTGFERRAVWRPFCLSVLPQRWAFWSLLWYLLGLLPDVPLAYQLSAGWLCAGGRIWGLVQQECCCKHIHLPLYRIRLPETSHWKFTLSSRDPASLLGDGTTRSCTIYNSSRWHCCLQGEPECHGQDMTWETWSSRDLGL